MHNSDLLDHNKSLNLSDILKLYHIQKQSKYSDIIGFKRLKDKLILSSYLFYRLNYLIFTYLHVLFDRYKTLS